MAPIPRSATALVVAAFLIGTGTAAPAYAGHRPPVVHDEQITYHGWSDERDWRSGTAQGVAVRAGVTIGRPVGTTAFTDPHTGATRSWEYATWTSPVYPI